MVQHLLKIHASIGDIGNFGEWLKPVDGRIQHGGLAGAHLADDHDKTAALPEAVHQRGERLLVAGA